MGKLIGPAALCGLVILCGCSVQDDKKSSSGFVVDRTTTAKSEPGAADTKDLQYLNLRGIESKLESIEPKLDKLNTIDSRLAKIPYDDCILQYMGNAQNRDAIFAIQRACISKASVPIPEEEATRIEATARAGKFSTDGVTSANGLVIELTNKTNYAITQVAIWGVDKQTGKTVTRAVNVFLPPFYGPGIITGYGDPRFNQIIEPTETKQFFAEMLGVPDSPESFPFSSWNVVPTKGIPSATTPAGRRPGATNIPPTCTEDEFNSNEGDCWIKLSAWEKQLTFVAFFDGWFQSFEFAERQQYDQFGRSRENRIFPSFDVNKGIAYFDQLYSVKDNRPISWEDAFDLLFRTESNPDTKDTPGLTALYRKHEHPLFSGYLRKFVPPNKVVISEWNDAVPVSPNHTVTITLQGVSADGNANAAKGFMAALLNVKQCNTLIRQTESYKFNFHLKTDKDKQEAKETAEHLFYPQLDVVIEYPQRNQEEFFNARNEMSGFVLLKKDQRICEKRVDNKYFATMPVTLGDLMLQGAKNEYTWDLDQDDLINLNQYLVVNGLRTEDRGDDDPRAGALVQFYGHPTPDGVKKILSVAAAQ